jgi:hypothetical protein
MTPGNLRKRLQRQEQQRCSQFVNIMNGGWDVLRIASGATTPSCSRMALPYRREETDCSRLSL